MKKRTVIGLAAIAAVFSVGAANAADMAPVYKAPPPAPIFSWTGFYIGANVGYSSGHSDVNGLASGLGDLTGIVGGGQIGYNWQAGGWVFGIEGDFQGTSEDAHASALGITVKESLPWFATFRGRLGYAIAPTWMIYATGGAAWVDHKFEATNGVATISSETSRVGWAAGVGLEAAINRNWSWKVEYLHLDTGSFSNNLFGVVPVTLKVTDDLGRIGVNYRF